MKPYYQDDSCTIYHGDCRDVLPRVMADAVVTDPPYGVGFAGKATKRRRLRGGYTGGWEDTPAYLDEVVIPVIRKLLSRTCHPPIRVVLTPGIRNMWRYPEPDAVGALFYPAGAGLGPWGFTCWQPIFYYGKDPYLATGQGHRPDSFSTLKTAGPDAEHPCPKSLKTMHWLVTKASLPGEVVLDPFAGSGTTLLAAKNLGRRAVGIEIEERYCEIAARRLGQEVMDFGEAA